MKVTLALSGGAARGAFHLGVLQALEELGIEIEAISGSSIGAVIAVGYGSGLKPHEMLDIFTSKEFRAILRFNYFQKGLLRIDEDAKVLEHFASVSRLEAMKIPTFITCVDLLSGKLLHFSQGEAISLAIASASLMPLFRPIRYENYVLIDGGFMDNLPIAPLQTFDVPLFGVDLHPLVQSPEKAFFPMYLRALFLAFIASSQQKIGQCSLYITDDKLTNIKLFGFSDLKKCYDLGYQSGKEQILTYLSQTMYNNRF